jgi:hypothetical protein
MPVKNNQQLKKEIEHRILEVKRMKKDYELNLEVIEASLVYYQNCLLSLQQEEEMLYHDLLFLETAEVH